MRFLLPEVFVPFRVAVMGLVFLLFFVAMTLYVYSSRRRQQYDQLEKLPLEDGIAVSNVKHRS
jgi:cbb3-type cytochrome oxidase subunit 3